MVVTRCFFAATLLLFSSLFIVSAIDYSQGSEPDLENSMPEEKEKPLLIGVEGHILCKSGGTSSIPIQGAVARITCLAVDEYGYETAPFSFLSDETDANGLFATLTPSEINEKLQVSQCKAFLENSPLEACKVPTDVNKGIRGALLNSYRFLNQREMKLYWVEPFFYTSEPKSLPNGY